ncbi:uncharacterized protein LOC118450416 isoform X1 [Vespa mandarinia]|uniref:uncharacterized protein LOC118450416 isoform X1 n=1 Tax=Vespa mandarinia TaxID=7446 RepID=UPI00160B8B2B|nr:uncharacterized protein LOC118450416 isoform X1 [Vespa mandarinia]
MMASKGWKVVRPHVPLIKFRKGGLNRVNVGASAAPSAASGTASATGRATGPQVIVLPTIDDIHLPSRFHRRPIDEKEIEYINQVPKFIDASLYHDRNSRRQCARLRSERRRRRQRPSIRKQVLDVINGGS